MSKRIEFANWLQGEMNRRSWSQAELARRAEVTRSVINTTINQKSFPGVEACRGIARALNLPVEEVFRRAGLLPESTEVDDLLIRRLVNIAKRLNDETKEDVIYYAECQLTRQEQERAGGVR